jgi:hypothetical protein
MCQTSNFAYDPYVTGIIGSVTAGFLTLGIIHVYKYLRKECWKYKLKAIFGNQENDQIKLILPVLRIRNEIIDFLKSNNFPDAEFPLRKYSGSYVRSEKLIGNCDARGLKYISDLLANKMNLKPELLIDEDLSKKLDLNFVAVGGSNFYCSYLLDQDHNPFFRVDGRSITSIKNNKVYTCNSHDYGLIMKVKPPSFPQKIWIIVVGIGETGTSGAAWYLSMHWKEIYKEYKNNEFGMVVKVKHGIDESAEIIDKQKV